MELFLVYMWLKLNAFIGWAIVVAVLSFFLGVVIPTVILLSDGDEYGTAADRWHEERGPIWKARRKLALKIFIPCTLFSLLTPNSTDTAILVASSVAIDVAKSPEGTKIGQLLRGKANELLDAELKKLSPQPTK